MKPGLKLLILFLCAIITALSLTGCNEPSGTDMPEQNSEGTVYPAETAAPVPVKISYDLGGAEGTAPQTIDTTSDNSITVESCTASLEGHFFGGWSDGEKYYYAGDTYTAGADVTLTARWIKKSSDIVLQDCASQNTWWGTNIAYETNDTDQTPCVTASSPADNCIIFCYAWYDAPLDLTAYKKDGCGVKLDVWVEDPTSILEKHGRFEMSAEMGYHASAWELSEIEWKQGWNTVTFLFDDLAVDEADFSKINYIRLYIANDPEKPITMKLDNLRAFSDTAPVNVRYESGYVADQTVFLTDHAILAAGSEITLPENTFTKLHYDFGGWKDGRGNIAPAGSTYTVDADTVFTAIWNEHPRYSVSFNLNGGTGTGFAPIFGYEGYYAYYPDSIPVKEGYVFAGWDNAGSVASSGDIIYMKAENVTVKALWEPISDRLEDGLVESWDLTDGGLSGNLISAIGQTNATHLWGTWLNSKTFGRTIDFSTAGSYAIAENSKADFSGDFTFSAWVKAPMRTLSDRTLFAYGEKYVEGEDQYYDFQTVDNMDQTGWSYCNLETRGQKEGDGYYTASTESGEILFFIKSFKPQDFSDYMEDGYIHMWVYAENADGIVSGDLEFTSSGNCDDEEISWSVPSLELEEGWNEVYLPFEKATPYGDAFRPDDFNFVRFYFSTKGSVKIGIDDISLCRKVEKEKLDGTKLYLDAENDYKLTFSMPGIEGIAAASTSLDDGLWHHVMLIKEGSTLTYYVDGKADGSCTVSGTPDIIGSTLVIGADLEHGMGFDGSMAEVKIYNKAKTPAEATDTVIDSYDNEQHSTRLSLKKGLVFDRRQYAAPRPYDYEGQTVRYDDVVNAKNMGFDHVKLLLTPNHLVNEDGTLKIENLEYITEVVNYAVGLELPCYICIHPEDNFKPVYLGKLDNFEILCRWYGELAAYIAGNWTADQVGLQLMTEPGSQNTNVDWSWFSDRMWSAARNSMPDHTIITSSDAYGNIERLKLMSPATDDNLIYSFTTYEPYTIGWYFYGEHKNENSFWKYIREIPYPVEEGVDYTDAIEYAIGLVPEHMKRDARSTLTAYVNGVRDNHMVNSYRGTLYNRDWHFARAKSLDDFSRANGGNIHFMAVEWGCMHFASEFSKENGTGCPDEQRYEYIKDIREAFEAYGIGWSYWSYQEAHTVFIPELHVYGETPSPEDAIKKFDWTLLEYSLGLTPLVEKPQN